MKLLLIPVLAFLVLGGDISAQRKRNWQDGTWRASERAQQFNGMIGSGSTTDGLSNSVAVPVYRVDQAYVIETADRWYVARHRLRWRWSKPVPLTINAPVRFAVEKDKIFVIGEDDKEYELSVVQKGIKQGVRPSTKMHEGPDAFDRFKKAMQTIVSVAKAAVVPAPKKASSKRKRAAKHR